jgi:hypothetical protein
MSWQPRVNQSVDFRYGCGTKCLAGIFTRFPVACRVTSVPLLLLSPEPAISAQADC